LPVLESKSERLSILQENARPEPSCSACMQRLGAPAARTKHFRQLLSPNMKNQWGTAKESDAPAGDAPPRLFQKKIKYPPHPLAKPRHTSTAISSTTRERNQCPNISYGAPPPEENRVSPAPVSFLQRRGNARRLTSCRLLATPPQPHSRPRSRTSQAKIRIHKNPKLHRGS